MLSEHEIERYSRQLVLPGWSSDFQTALKTRVVVLPETLPALCLSLVGAGIGTLFLLPAGQEAALVQHARRLNPNVCITRWSVPADTLVHYGVFFDPTQRLMVPPDCFDKTHGAILTVEGDRLILEEINSPEQAIVRTLPPTSCLDRRLLIGSLAAAMILACETRRYSKARSFPSARTKIES